MATVASLSTCGIWSLDTGRRSSSAWMKPSDLPLAAYTRVFSPIGLGVSDASGGAEFATWMM